MGLFAKKPQQVQVAYHDLASAREFDPSRSSGYTFRWTLSTRPQIGLWVWVDGIEGPSTGVIVALAPGVSGIELKPVLSIVSDTEMEQFARAREYNAQMQVYNLALWLDMARAKAGLPVGRELPSRAPDPYEQIPPAKGRVTGAAAKDRGRIWWNIYNRAMEESRPADEIARFKEIADEWYARSRMKTAT